MWPFGSAYPEKRLQDVSGREFDYIVVGAGTAGCAVASRLSEDPDVSVLVLEKGSAQDTWASRVPLMSCDVDQAAGTVNRYAGPDPNCNDRALRYVSCEAVGGCSRINGMLYTRGMPAVYDQWERMGNAGWSWADVEGYFSKVEGMRPRSDASSATAQHAQQGQVQILQDSPEFEVYDRIHQLAPEFGIPVRDDLNNASALPEGLFPYPLTIDSARRRHSALHSYLSQDIANQREDRLAICTGVIGTRLELDAERGLATGIYVQPTKRPVGPGPDEVLVKAKREGILCGGTICSPQLLQLSGIGPAGLLERHGIEPKRDLPGVGAAFADHQAIPVGIEVPWDQTLQYLGKSPLHAVWHLLRYATTGAGWMGSSTTHAAIWLNTERLDPATWTLPPPPQPPGPDPGRDDDDPADPANIPDVEIMLIPASGVPDAHPGRPLFTLYTCLLRPESRGLIEIRSPDARDDPSIRPNLLSHPGDLAVARRALRFALRLAERFVETWQRPSALYLAPRRSGVVVDADAGAGCDLSDGELDEFVRANIRSMYHLTSTCRMAPEADGGVVDERLRVHGFRNLRVADASVFPTIPAAHTMAPTYMVAERCADFVKSAWAERPR